MKASHAIKIVFICFFAAVTSPALAVKVEEVTTPGGLKAWLVQDHTNPIISLRFAFRGGSALDPKDKSGLSNMAASTIDEGAGKLNSQAFQQMLQDRAIRLRFSAGIDNFAGQLQTLVRHKKMAFDLLRLALTVPRFEKETVERTRAQILLGLKRNQESPHKLASKALRKALYGDHPYGQSVNGKTDSVKAITIKDLHRFVEKRFARNNLVIGVVGNIAPKKLAYILDATFGSLPAMAADWKLTKRRANTIGQTIVIKKDIPQSVIMFADQGVLRNSPNFYAAFVMNHILGGGGFTSRLYEEVREKRGLAYTISSRLDPRQASATLVGGTATANARVEETIGVLKKEWQRMANYGVTEQELNDAKTYLTGAYPLRFSESGRIASMLVGIQLAEIDISFVQNRNDQIMAVTRKDITEIAKKLLDAARLVVVIVGRPEGVLANH